jgi:8-oxo-dGTP diphosphatase
MWTYVIAFTEDLDEFVMVRSRKRGGWEMPGGRLGKGEDPVTGARREFTEETGMELFTDVSLSTRYRGGTVFFGVAGEKKDIPPEDEIEEVAFHSRLPEDLAYPEEEYIPLIEMAKKELISYGRRGHSPFLTSKPLR